MKYLTRKRAIELCIELWSWLAETGKRKSDWPEWEKYEEKYGYSISKCWFCDYDTQQDIRYQHGLAEGCSYCPLFKQIGHCNEKTFYKNWAKARTAKIRKKYAKLFLEQVKSLR